MARRNLAVPVLALALAATSCGGEDTVEVGGERANDHGAEDVSGRDSIEFELDDFYFEPTILNGSAGETITLEAFNEGDESHTLTIEDQGVDEIFDPDARRSVEVTFPDSGELVFVCRFHAEQGMRGALVVSGGGRGAGGGTDPEEEESPEPDGAGETSPEGTPGPGYGY